jgi:hypothetical protein
VAFWSALRRWSERAIDLGILTIDDIRSGDPAACTLLLEATSLAPAPPLAEDIRYLSCLVWRASTPVRKSSKRRWRGQSRSGGVKWVRVGPGLSLPGGRINSPRAGAGDAGGGLWNTASPVTVGVARPGLSCRKAATRPPPSLRRSRGRPRRDIIVLEAAPEAESAVEKRPGSKPTIAEEPLTPAEFSEMPEPPQSQPRRAWSEPRLSRLNIRCGRGKSTSGYPSTPNRPRVARRPGASHSARCCGMRKATASC